MNNPIKSIPRDNHFRKYLLVLMGLSFILGILIVPIEQGNKINNIGDGLWWVISTITGVGYGDLVPVTGLGRLIGSVLMTVGLVLFSLIVAILSGQIMKKEERYWRGRMKKDLESVNNKLYRLEKKLDFLIKEKTRLG